MNGKKAQRENEVARKKTDTHKKHKGHTHSVLQHHHDRHSLATKST